MTEEEVHAYVQEQLQTYLTNLEAAGTPYTQNPDDWETMAAAIAAAAEAVYQEQGAPPPPGQGPDGASTLATQVQQSDLIAGVPAAVDAHIAAAVTAGTAVGVLLTAEAPAWAPLITVVATNVFLWATAAGAAAAAVYAGLRRKTWIARDDTRTRPAHAAADGQTVSIFAPFHVGGFNLRYPHDPFGPPGQTYNCRCVARYS